jgi:DNA-binding NarL/FixJ family response regulator
MKILVADDHVLFREGLRFVLEDLGIPGVDVLECGSFAQAEQSLKRTPDIGLVLLDLSMPGMDGLAGLQLMRRQAPDVPVVVVTASEDPRHVRRAMELGARGYITKTGSSESMLNGLRTVLAGGIFVSPQLTMAMPEPEQQSTAAATAVLAQLTPRQVDVLAMLRKGKSNKEIGRELNLAEITVKMHVTAILKALGVHNRTQAAIMAEQLGL